MGVSVIMANKPVPVLQYLAIPARLLGHLPLMAVARSVLTAHRTRHPCSRAPVQSCDISLESNPWFSDRYLCSCHKCPLVFRNIERSQESSPISYEFASPKRLKTFLNQVSGWRQASRLPPDMILIRSASPRTITVCPFIGYMVSSPTSFFEDKPVQLITLKADSHEGSRNISGSDLTSATCVLSPRSVQRERRRWR